MNVLPLTPAQFFNDNYMVPYIWLKTKKIIKDSFPLAARYLLYAPPHSQEFYVTPVTLAGMRNSSTGPQGGFNLMTNGIINRHFTTELSPASLVQFHFILFVDCHSGQVMSIYLLVHSIVVY